MMYKYGFIEVQSDDIKMFKINEGKLYSENNGKLNEGVYRNDEKLIVIYVNKENRNEFLDDEEELEVLFGCIGQCNYYDAKSENNENKKFTFVLEPVIKVWAKTDYMANYFADNNYFRFMCEPEREKLDIPRGDTRFTVLTFCWPASETGEDGMIDPEEKDLFP